MNKPSVVALLALLFAVPCANAQMMMPSTESESLDGIVAVLDEEVILRSELDRAVAAVTAQYAKNPGQLPPRAELERQVLDRLIMLKLQVARADSTGVKLSDAEVDQTIGQIAQQNRLDVGQLRQAVQQQGIGWDAFRKNVHDETLVQRLRQRVVQSRVQISDTEVELLIKNGGVSNGEMHLGHILVTIPEGATPDQVAAAEAKAADVRRQIAGGLDFAAAAIRFSDAPNALEGGDLGWRSTNELPPAFAELGETLSAGETAEPVRGPNGFHIIKLIEKRAGSQQLVTEYHARHILIKTNEIVSADQARAKIDALRTRIVAGEDFGKVAKEASDDAPTANIGGDLGWFPINGYGTRVAEALQASTDGQLGEPFQTEVGWHLLQRLATRTEDRTAQAEREKARQVLGSRKADEEYEGFLRQIRSEAYIDIRLPAAASAG